MANDNKKDLKDEVDAVDERTARIFAKMFAEAMPTMAAVIAQSIQAGQQNAKNAEALALEAARPTGERCTDCRQLLPRGCKQGEHKHKKIVVFPRDKRYAKWFLGVRINSVLYLSNGPNHAIVVPEDCAIEQLIEGWEDNETELAHGRVAAHDSGSIGAATSKFNQANAGAGWR